VAHIANGIRDFDGSTSKTYTDQCAQEHLKRHGTRETAIAVERRDGEPPRTNYVQEEEILVVKKALQNLPDYNPQFGRRSRNDTGEDVTSMPPYLLPLGQRRLRHRRDRQCACLTYALLTNCEVARLQQQVRNEILWLSENPALVVLLPLR